MSSTVVDGDTHKNDEEFVGPSEEPNCDESLTLYPCVYVLLLSCEKYYVGITNNLNLRLAQHYEGKGAQWTRIFKPLMIYEVVYPGTKKMELQKTLEMMTRFGWKNVRGSHYCQMSMKNPPKLLDSENFLKTMYKRPTFLVKTRVVVKKESEVDPNSKLSLLPDSDS